MRSSEILMEGKDASLFHGLKIEYALKALVENKIEARTFQRWWPDGKRRQESDPLYKSSFIMKGFSTTRDFDFALGWGEVIFSFNQRKISQKYKIIPYNWGYHIDMVSQHHKREKEEFIALNMLKRTIDEYYKEWDKIKYTNTDKEINNAIDYLCKPEGKPFEPLDYYLNAIYLSETGFRFCKEKYFILNHPKFAGIVTDKIIKSSASIELKQEIQEINKKVLVIPDKQARPFL